MRESPRIRRLRSDYRGLVELRADSTVLDFKSEGHPAERYVLRFQGRGLWRPSKRELHKLQRSQPENHWWPEDGIIVRHQHEVRVTLGASYPRMMPSLNWLTPIFHPNISESGIVCLGDYGTHWVPSLSLAELCEMLWDMIRYRNLDVESPYNREAAMWARTQTSYAFPLDPRPIRDRLAARHVADGRPPVARADPPPENGSEVVILDERAEVLDAEVLDADDADIVFLD